MRLGKRTIVSCVVLLALRPAVGVRATPPKVIESVPANGDQRVDPSLDQMRFVFDQDMTTGSDGWTNAR